MPKTPPMPPMRKMPGTLGNQVLFIGVKSVLCFLCGIASAGCGYSLAGHGSFLPAYIRTVGVPTFTNHSPIFNLETTLTQKVRSELIGRGKYTVLPQDNGVDALLVGDVSSVSIAPASFNAQQLASRYTISIVANIQLRDLHENKVLWENPGLLFRQDYENTSGQNVQNAAAFFGQETNALD